MDEEEISGIVLIERSRLARLEQIELPILRSWILVSLRERLLLHSEKHLASTLRFFGQVDNIGQRIREQIVLMPESQ